MPSVYRLWTDDKFQSLEPADMQAYLQARRKTWKFDGFPIGELWTPLQAYVRRPTLKKPDIWGIANTVAFEPKAASILQLCLDQAGEQFKLPFEDRNLVLLNVTYVIDCLDKQHSDFDPDLPHIIEHHAFHADRLDYSLFKIPETRASEILTVEGLSSPNEEFKPLVEKYGLKGVRFEEIWSDK